MILVVEFDLLFVTSEGSPTCRLTLVIKYEFNSSA